MSTFLFVGHAPRYYPGFGNLVALPGDVCEFEVAPADGLWAEASGQPVTDTSGRSWPISSFQADANQEAAAEVPLEPPPVLATEAEQPAPVPQDTPLPFAQF